MSDDSATSTDTATLSNIGKEMKKGAIYRIPGLHVNDNFKYRYLGDCEFEIVSAKYPTTKPIIKFSEDFMLKMEKVHEDNRLKD